MSYYFKGNVFNDRFNMTKLYNPNWGDTDDKPRDDYERASDAYAEVRANAPNYVQMHHQMGVLHLKKADYERSLGNQAQAEKELDAALHWFQMYRNIDPVFPPNYFRMGQVYMIRRQYDKAIEVYNGLLEARECEVDPALSERPGLRRTILAYQELKDRGGVFNHKHDMVDVHLQLGNAYFMKGDLAGSERAYKDALRLDPKNDFAMKNLQVVYARAKNEGKLKIVEITGAEGQKAPLLEVIQKK